MHICILGACAKVGSKGLDIGRTIHDNVGIGADSTLNNAILKMYNSCGNPEIVLALWKQLLEQKLPLTDATYSLVLKACANAASQEALHIGSTIHSMLNGKRNFKLTTALIGMYTYCGQPQRALELWKEDKHIIQPSFVTTVAVLKACALVGTDEAYAIGQSIYADSRIGLSVHDELVVDTAAMDMFVKCGDNVSAISLTRKLLATPNLLDNVCLIAMLVCCANGSDLALGTHIDHTFDISSTQDSFLLNTLLTMYTKCGNPKKVLELWNKVQVVNLETYMCLFAACADVGLPALDIGKAVHLQLQQSGLVLNIRTVNTLINMYTCCGEPLMAIELYNKIEQLELTPTNVTFTCILLACASLGQTSLALGKSIHKKIAASGEIDERMLTSLMTMYTKCGQPQVALALWRSILPGDAGKHGWICALTAHAEIGICTGDTLLLTKQVHEEIRKEGDSSYLCNALLNLYAKCGMLDNAEALFEEVCNKGVPDIVCWNTMIAAFSDNLAGAKAVNTFTSMIAQGVQPNAVTFVALLAACSASGLVDTALAYYNEMTSTYSISFIHTLTTNTHHTHARTHRTLILL